MARFCDACCNSYDHAKDKHVGLADLRTAVKFHLPEWSEHLYWKPVESGQVKCDGCGGLGGHVMVGSKCDESTGYRTEPTASVEDCRLCNGSGHVRCKKCHGTGSLD